jgi:cellulose biosynthesis protein BcsQ
VSIWTTIPAVVTAPPSIPVLSVGNLKGGVGKTTVVANLAVALVQSGLRVLLIDLDFQASLSVALPSNIMPRHETSDGGVNVLLGTSYDMFHDNQVTGRGVGIFADLSLVRTSIELAEFEDRLFAAFLLGQSKQDPRFNLARLLSDPRLENDFDIVIVDTPPRLTMASINAHCACTHVLIPTALTPMSQSGAVTFAAYLDGFRKTLCPSLNILGVLATFTKSTPSDPENKVLDKLQKYLPKVEVWRDIRIPLRQDIANGKVQGNNECKEIFQSLATKMIGKLGLRSDGSNESRHSHRSTFFGRWGLSQ